MRQIAQITIICLVLASTAGIATAQTYYDPPPTYQSRQPNCDPPLRCGPLVPATQVDPRAFAIQPLPQVGPWYEQRSSGVIIAPNGEAYYFYGNGR